MTHHTTPDGIAYVRTPDERFVGLDDFPYEPKYGSVDGLRMAYIDEGPRMPIQWCCFTASRPGATSTVG